MNYKFGGTFILLLAGLLVLTIVFGSWYTVDQTQRGGLLRNGALVEVGQPGLHFKWPWIEAVSKNRHADPQLHLRESEFLFGRSAASRSANFRDAACCARQGCGDVFALRRRSAGRHLAPDHPAYEPGSESRVRPIHRTARYYG